MIIYNWTLIIFEKRSQCCHPERSEGSLDVQKEILRCAQDDSIIEHFVKWPKSSIRNIAYLKIDTRLRGLTD